VSEIGKNEESESVSEIEKDEVPEKTSEIEKIRASETVPEIEKSGEAVGSEVSELVPEIKEREVPEAVFEIDRNGMPEAAPVTATSNQVHPDDEEKSDLMGMIIPQNDGSCRLNECTSEGDLEPGVGPGGLRDRDPESGVRITG
jgi:hypothetical protein